MIASEPEGRVAVAWSGLPLYAAAALKHGISRVGREVSIIGTAAGVPVTGVDAVVGQAVHWIPEGTPTTFGQIGIPVPRVLFISGWHVPAFLALAADVRRHGGAVITMVDNCYRGDARQLLGGLFYRMRYETLFDHAWVPGASARRLMRSYGVPEERITLGLYTADTNTFRVHRPITERPMQFTFVGQFIDRKNVRRVHDSFLHFRSVHNRVATLVMHGSGPLRTTFTDTPSIAVRDFVAPEQLVAVLNNTRALVLPSVIDHWPLVVHEAALCGCALILSNRVGSLPEFQTTCNSYIVRASSSKDLIEAFRWAADLSDAELATASADSVERASAFNHTRWADAFQAICARYLQ